MRLTTDLKRPTVVAESWRVESPVELFYREAAKEKWHPSQVRGLFAEVIAELRDFLRGKAPRSECDAEADTRLLEVLKDSQTLRSLHETCVSYVISLTERMGPRQSIDRTVANIVQTIKDHPERLYELEDLAEGINYSSNYLGQVFKKITGEPLTHFVTNQRMERAKLLLLTTDRKTFEIAQDVGFPNYRYFNRLFKRSVGCSPTEFRAKGAYLS